MIRDTLVMRGDAAILRGRVLQALAAVLLAALVAILALGWRLVLLLNLPAGRS
jgi:hypothetical protein